jgi:hypothetical protein
MRFACWITQADRIFNTYSFSTAIVVTRTRLILRLYVHCLLFSGFHGGVIEDSGVRVYDAALLGDFPDVLQDFGNYSPRDAASHTRRPESSKQMLLNVPLQHPG